MKNWRGVLLMSFIVSAPVVSLEASSGTEGAAFLDIPVGAGPAALGSAYTQKVTDKVALGLTGKLIDAKIAGVSAQAYAADLGIMAQITDRLKLAATATNLGSKLTFTSQGDSLPMAVHFAGAYQPEKHW